MNELHGHFCDSMLYPVYVQMEPGKKMTARALLHIDKPTISRFTICVLKSLSPCHGRVLIELQLWDFIKENQQSVVMVHGSLSELLV